MRQVPPLTVHAQLKRLFPLLLVIFLDSFGYFLIIPILLQIFYKPDFGLLPHDASMGVRNIVTGTTLALSQCASLVAAPFIGALSDKYGRKKTLLLCLVGILIGFILPIIGIWKKSLSLILLSRLVGGVGSSSQPIAQAAVADLCTGKERAYFLSLIALMMTLPIILGPLVGGYLSNPHLVSWFTINTPFWVASIISFLSFILILFLFEETLSEQPMRNQMSSMWEVISGFRHIKQYHIGVLFLIFFFLELGWSQYYQSIFLYLNQVVHYSAQKVGLFNTYMGVLMSLGLVLLYPVWIRLYSVLSVMRISIFLVFIGLLSIALWATAHAQWIFVPLVAIFTGTAYVSLISLISHRVPSHVQGKIMGYASTLLTLAWMLTAFNGGALISFHPAAPLYLSVVFLAIAGIGLFFYFNHERET